MAPEVAIAVFNTHSVQKRTTTTLIGGYKSGIPAVNQLKYPA